MSGNEKEAEVILGTEGLAEKILGSQPGKQLTDLIAFRISERRRVESQTSSDSDSPKDREKDHLDAVVYLEIMLPLLLSRRLRASNLGLYGQAGIDTDVENSEEFETDEDADLVMEWLNRIN